MEGIPGVPAPIPHSKLVSADRVRIGGPDQPLLREPAAQPLVPIKSSSEVAEMSPQARAEYIQTIGREATGRALGKVVDILA